MDSENCVAAVTGASRGIGGWVARTLAERGYVVAANDLEAPEDTLKEIENTGNTAIFVPGNVSDEASVRRMVEAVVGELERVDVLVNNAGVSLITPDEETTSAESP
ncbi:MAG TPA: SDR family NAD(P)-dependent oxidoreductase [Rubrobacteraceae bacterium]|nr:SDR family NAD(P)-dependent oxidoreductase [Rubrobacteraceae bacterium]